MISKLLTISLLVIATSAWGQFPGCPAVDAGPDVSTDCSIPCVDLTAAPFDAGATTGYDAYSVPHAPPIAYDAPGGTAVSVGTDDVWSGAINLPFDFCFYGQTYTSCVVGSNGCIDFGTANAGAGQPWSFTASCPSVALTSAGDIFGPYHDIDPSVAGTVNWYVLGTAPCRIFVVSFNDLAHFSCTSLTSTHMMVLYETTNAIDVYIENKATCGTWNSGNTVVGIQNDAGTQGIAAPGRNTGAWTVTTPEGWRFMPNGAPIYTLEWFEGATSLGSNPQINVCPTTTTTYTVEATYTSCNGTVIVESDDVTVTVNNGGFNLLEVSNTGSACGSATGSFEVDANGGAGSYMYSLNDTLNFQGSPIFTGLAPGTYTVYAQDAGGCIVAITVVIDSPSSPDLSLLGTINSTCDLPNGELDVEAINGLQPYEFSIDAGVNTQTTGTFTGLLAGTYLVQVEDQNNCIDTMTVTIGADPFPVASMVSTDTICSNGSNGEVTVSVVDGVSPYMFSVDGNPAQASPVFTGLTVGVHDFIVTDSVGCTSEISIEVYAFDDPSIFGDTSACNLTLNVTGTNSYAGGVWSTLDTAITFLPSANDENPVINSSTPGTYNVTFTDNECNMEITSQIYFYDWPGTWLVDTTLCEGVIYNLTAPDNNVDPTVYEWGNGTFGQTIEITQPGDYILYLSNACHSGIDTVHIEYKLCDINAPNVLSLAQGSQNSLWYVEAEGLGKFNVTITNRWGNVMYNCVDSQAKCYWDGRAQNGAFVQPGTYFYTIDAETENGGEIVKHGFIQVVD